jgi:hypothetical protein
MKFKSPLLARKLADMRSKGVRICLLLRERLYVTDVYWRVFSS